MGAKNEDIRRARLTIKRKNEIAEDEHRRQLLKKRIEVATTGVKAYQANKIAEAVMAFQTYLRILEDWKGVGPGGLTPALFDRKKDVAELLLISSVYWDLVKLYDRTKSVEKRKDFLGYMEKFILFSKGMPYRTLCSENLRRYISNENPTHATDFKSAYKILSGSNCFVVTSLVDVIDESTLPRLRLFRDEYLGRSRFGRHMIRTYDRVGPLLAFWMDRSPGWLRKGVGRFCDFVGRLV